MSTERTGPWQSTRSTATRPPVALSVAAPTLIERYLSVRATTARLAAPLSAEDAQLQAMADVSPPKWHLAHTTWFFETFVLARQGTGYQPFDARYGELFNSYYETLGSPYPRAQRGCLSRPDLATVKAYRDAVDDAMLQTLQRLTQGYGHPSGLSAAATAEIVNIVETGLQHEMQHQELMLTDTLYNFFMNPLRPAYASAAGVATPAAALIAAAPTRLGFCAFPGGLFTLGASGDGFVFDNEQPAHRLWLEPYLLADRLVTNGEFEAFIADGGYRRPELWLADGWAACRRADWQAPLYWLADRQAMTLHGLRPRLATDPVAYLSYYEADAYARWQGARLPTEGEWEAATAAAATCGNFLESEALAPRADVGSPLSRLGWGATAAAKPETTPGCRQLFGDVWEWTASPYVAYPGFRTPTGALGEYNGKFMANQMVLRGGSCLTPAAQVRRSYRNFFPPAARWQCAGVRLARDP